MTALVDFYEAVGFKFNPHHDARGRFSEGAGSISPADIPELEAWEGERGRFAAQAYYDIRDTPDVRGIVMRDKGEIVGIVSIRDFPKVSVVRRLATKRAGYGRQMMLEIARSSTEQRRGIYLQAAPDAKPFYQHLGMVEGTGRESGTFSWTFKQTKAFTSEVGEKQKVQRPKKESISLEELEPEDGIFVKPKKKGKAGNKKNGTKSIVALGCSPDGFPVVAFKHLPRLQLEATKALSPSAYPFEDERFATEKKLAEAVAVALAAIQQAVFKRLNREARSLKELIEEYGRKALSDVPADQAFWDGQKAAFFEQAGPATQDALMAAAMQAESFGLAFDFDLVNQGVLEFTRTFGDEWWSRLEGTTREGLRAAIGANISTGAPLSTLKKSLEPLFGRTRADMIASTETTRLYAEGNILAYRAAGVTQLEFRTRREFHLGKGRVCDRCREHDGEKFPIDDTSLRPPLHVRCACWAVPVVDDKPLEILNA